jgi:hypothetical protein
LGYCGFACAGKAGDPNYAPLWIQIFHNGNASQRQSCLQPLA